MDAMRWDLQSLDIRELLSLCVANTEDHVAWSEFMRRFAAKIRTFIHRTLRLSFPGFESSQGAALPGGIQEADLFQNTILRLVEKGCGALRRFSGDDEEQFLAYLAVVARSVVRDHLRRQQALKRSVIEGISVSGGAPDAHRVNDSEGYSLTPDPNHNILAGELVDLSMRAIRHWSGPSSARNEIIFHLHYFENLSAAQIARCNGIGLSKTGVEKVLRQLHEHVRAAAEQEPMRVT